MTICDTCAFYDSDEVDACSLCDDDFSFYMPKPKTNGDRIRAMSDEELSTFRLEMDACPPDYRQKCPYDREYYYTKACDGCWLRWLKTPAKEEQL